MSSKWTDLCLCSSLQFFFHFWHAHEVFLLRPYATFGSALLWSLQRPLRTILMVHDVRKANSILVSIVLVFCGHYSLIPISSQLFIDLFKCKPCH